MSSRTNHRVSSRSPRPDTARNSYDGPPFSSLPTATNNGTSEAHITGAIVFGEAWTQADSAVVVEMLAEVHLSTMLRPLHLDDVGLQLAAQGDSQYPASTEIDVDVEIDQTHGLSSAVWIDEQNQSRPRDRHSRRRRHRHRPSNAERVQTSPLYDSWNDSEDMDDRPINDHNMRRWVTQFATDEPWSAESSISTYQHHSSTRDFGSSYPSDEQETPPEDAVPDVNGSADQAQAIDSSLENSQNYQYHRGNH